MTTLNYPVELHAENGRILIDFVDFPEAHTFGENEEEALMYAKDCLEAVLAVYMEDGLVIPFPSKAGNKYTVSPSCLTASKVLLYQSMKNKGISKAELARRMNCFAPQIDRLLDLKNNSRIPNIEAAFAVMDQKMTINIEDIRA